MQKRVEDDGGESWLRAYKIGATCIGLCIVVGGIGRLIAGPGSWPSDLLSFGLSLALGSFLGMLLGGFLGTLFASQAMAGLDDSPSPSSLHAGLKWAAGPVPKWVAISGPFLGLAAATASLVWRSNAPLPSRAGFIVTLFGIPLAFLLMTASALKDPPAEPAMPSEPTGPPVSTSRAVLVGAAAAVLGLLVSIVIGRGLATGASLIFPGDNFESPFAEHPFVRVLFGALSSVAGGYVAGNIAPRGARRWAVASAALPAVVWALIAGLELSALPTSADRSLERFARLVAGLLLPIVTLLASYLGGVAGARDATSGTDHRSLLGSVRVIHWLWLLPALFACAHLASVATATALTSTFSFADVSLARVLGVPENGWDWVGLPRPGELKSFIVGLAVGFIGGFPVKRLLATIEVLAAPGEKLPALRSALLNFGGAVVVVAASQFFLNVTGWSPLPTIEQAEQRISRRLALKYTRGATPPWLAAYHRFLDDLAASREQRYEFVFQCGRAERPFECRHTLAPTEQGALLEVSRRVEETDGGVTALVLRLSDHDGNGLPDEAEFWERGAKTCADPRLPPGSACPLPLPRDDPEDPVLDAFAAWDMGVVMALEDQGRWYSGRRLLPRRQ